MAVDGRIPSSFRDPSGHVFVHGGTLYRQINSSYQTQFEHLIDSGLYEALTKKQWLVPHSVADVDLTTEDAYQVIRPEQIPFVSYPYEWCFSQLQDAALLTLEIQKLALQHGMSLKDASAYNVQFIGSRPVFIDTLSFERHEAGSPWVAYRQFCQHFLAPLALAAHRDARLTQLLRTYIDGIPLDLASELLPKRTRFKAGLLTHVHLHARAQRRYAAKKAQSRGKMGRISLLGLIDSLEGAVRQLRWRARASEWGNYYEDTNYSPQAMRHKADAVAEYLDRYPPQMVWDLGANTGQFSRIVADRGATSIAFDIDPVAVEKHYQDRRDKEDATTLPLWLDLTNPSPAIGWENEERSSLLDRGPADTVLALALVHHLAITHNLPLGRIARFLARACRTLIIEFVPKEDGQVQRMLATRDDIFTTYDRTSFETAFSRYFHIGNGTAIEDSNRWLYLMRLKTESSARPKA